MTPLARRLPRELRNNLGKYLGIFLGIFLLMTDSIALTSGFLLAAHSIGRIIDSMRDEYAIEDGRVTTSFEATSAQLKAAEDAAEDAGGAPTYTYSFTFNDRDLSVADRTDAEEDMVDALTDADARVDDLIDADSNQGIGYARNDVDGDSMMWTTLLDIIIVIMAFVFVVLTDATIEEGNAIIGTLLTAAEDAEDELDDAADVAQEAAETAMASPSAASMQAASDALEKAQDKKDALYARLDDIADALDCDRDEVIDLIDDASGIDTDNDDIHPVNTTDNGTEKIAQAEKYAVYQLQYDRSEGNGTETVTVYGVSPDSRYWKDLGVGDGHVMFGGGLVDKFGWKDGQQVSLTDKFEGKDYAFDYDGNSWGSKSDMNAYMSIDDFNELFGNDPSYFNGYVSDEELDLDSRYFAGDTTPDDMRAAGDQFIGMMSDLIGMMVGLSVFIFLLFMYLLTKAVIGRSARSISYMKVFGYRDGEISHLYIRSITLCVIAALLLSQPVIIGSLTAIFRSMLLAYNGNIEIYVPWWSIAACVGIGFATYLVVALLHTRSIRRVSLSEALKVQE